MDRQIAEIQALATKYSKADLGRMVQLGLLEPQKAMMAGMMIQRIEQQNMKPPQATVAQEVLGLPAVPNQPQQPQMPPQGVATLPAQRAPNPGIEALPAGNVGNYAGGGIVAFADKGLVEEEAIYDPLTGALISGPAPTPYSRNVRPGTVYEPSLFQDIFSGRPTTVAPVRATQADARRVDTQIDEQAGRRAPPPPAAPAAPRGEGAAPMPKAPDVSKSLAITPPSFKPFDINAMKVSGEELPGYTARERKDIATARRQAEMEEGVDPEMYAKMIKGVEEKKGKLEKRKGEVSGEALMMAGLGLLGARRGQEFQALGEAGKAALGAYKQDIKDLRAAEEKYDERIDALRMSDQQAKMTGARADIAQAEKDRELAFNANVKRAEARNELAKTSAQVSANVYGAETQRDLGVYKTQQETAIAEKQLAMEKYKADLSARVQSMYTNALRQGQLDERRARTLIEAADSFIKANGERQPYFGNPQLLQQDAMAYAQRLADQFMRTGPAAQNAPAPASPANRPPLSSFNR